MKSILHLLQFRFLSSSSDLGLLILRVWIGLSMFFLHGLDKVMHFSHLSTHFYDPLHVGILTSLILSIICEFGGSILVVLGLFTRLGALLGIIDLCVAFFFIHHLSLAGPHNGQLAFMYLAGYFTLFFAGGGRFSLDRS